MIDTLVLYLCPVVMTSPLTEGNGGNPPIPSYSVRELVANHHNRLPKSQTQIAVSQITCPLCRVSTQVVWWEGRCNRNGAEADRSLSQVYENSMLYCGLHLVLGGLTAGGRTHKCQYRQLGRKSRLRSRKTGPADEAEHCSFDEAAFLMSTQET